MMMKIGYKTMKLNFFQRLLKKVGLLKIIYKDKIVYKDRVVTKQEEIPSLALTNTYKTVTCVINKINFNEKELTLKVYGLKKDENLKIKSSDFEYKKVNKNTFIIKY